MNDESATTGTTTTDAGGVTTAVDQTTNTASTAADQAAPDTAAGTQDAKPAEPAVPESYELKMPEGVELDTAAAGEFTEIAKELKLTQEQAQKVADIGAKMAQRQAESHANLVAQWTEQVKTDKEIGGDKLAENLGVARKAIETFGSPELKDLLNSTGLGNHPEIVKLAFKVGKAISEDGFMTGKPKGAENDPAKTMFPNMS